MNSALGSREHVQALPADTIVISGGARGVDETAERVARSRGLAFWPMTVYTAGLPEDPEDRRREFSRRAYQRNSEIVAKADEVVAFWTWCSRDGCHRLGRHVTHGTDHAMSEARRLGKPLTSIGPDGKDWP